MTVLITGDVHGKINEYVNQVTNSRANYSIQIGDMGFDYSALSRLHNRTHKFFGGNHDNYDIYHDTEHSLGDFGRFSLGELDAFFIRGGYSLDWHRRIINESRGGGKSYWPQEQLNDIESGIALSMYKKEKPNVMMSHSCPDEFAKVIGDPKVLGWFGIHDPDSFTTNTQQLLQSCFNFHKPDVWIFGHFHINLDFIYKGTRFICLNELSTCVYEDGKFTHKGRYTYRSKASIQGRLNR